MANQLPQFIVIGLTNDGKLSSNAYYMYNSEKGAGLVCCNTGGTVFDPLAKIEVETARANKKYVHLKFAHTNKYWGRRGPGPNDYWIRATSDQPEEDVSKPSCTLFEPSIRGPGLLQLTHVQSRGALQLGPSSRHRGIYSTPGAAATTFGYMDCDVLIRFPKRVLFKGDNNKYLKAYNSGGYPHLQFGSQDNGDRYVAHEVELHPTGHVRIKNVYFGSFWRCNPDNWILGGGSSSTSPSVLFWPVRGPNGTIALRSARNNQFCKRLTVDKNRTDCLSASASTIDQYAKLRLEEPVVIRNIYGVEYRMNDARVYDERPVVAGSGSASNPANTAASMTVLVGYTKGRSYTFTRGFSIKAGVSTEIKSGIPFLAEGKIQVSAEVSTNFQWDSTKDESQKAEISYTAVVPPRSTVVIDYIATSGKCSVPFSYTQKDVSSIDGQHYTSQYTDGIYTGLDYYSFRFVQREIRRMKETDLP